MEQRWWTSGKLWWNRYGEIVEQIWRNSAKEMVEQWNNDGGTEEQRWWNSGTEIVDQWNNDGGTVEQIW